MKLILLFIGLFISNTSFACSCDELPSIEVAFSKTPVVFTGKVIAIDYVSIWTSINPSKKDEVEKNFLELFFYKKNIDIPIITKVEIEVLKTYKGEALKDTVTIFTARAGASCGFTWFNVGKKFIIYASPQSYYLSFIAPNSTGLERKNTYWTHQCTRTKNYYEKEVAALDKLSTTVGKD